MLKLIESIINLINRTLDPVNGSLGLDGKVVDLGCNYGKSTAVFTGTCCLY